jgi:hypothetical protein
LIHLIYAEDEGEVEVDSHLGMLSLDQLNQALDLVE